MCAGIDLVRIDGQASTLLITFLAQRVHLCEKTKV